MRIHSLIGVACLSLSIGLGACEKKKAEPARPTSTPPVGGALKDAAGKMSDAAKSAGQAVDQAAKEARDKIVAESQSMYDSAKKELDDLAAKVSSSASAEKPVWQQLVNSVEANLDDAGKKLDEMKGSSADLTKLGDDFRALMNKVTDGIKSLASKVK